MYNYLMACGVFNAPPPDIQVAMMADCTSSLLTMGLCTGPSLPPTVRVGPHQSRAPPQDILPTVRVGPHQSRAPPQDIPPTVRVGPHQSRAPPVWTPPQDICGLEHMITTYTPLTYRYQIYTLKRVYFVVTLLSRPLSYNTARLMSP